MVFGNKIAILGATLLITNPNLVNDDNASTTLEIFKSEIKSIVSRVNLGATGTYESSNFRVTIDTPCTFDLIFGSVIRASDVKEPKVLSVKDQKGVITSYNCEIDFNCSVYVSVIGQIFRAEYLSRLYNLIESSTQKTILLNEVNGKLASLYATPTLLGPVADDLFAAVDGALYLCRDTITDVSDFFVTVPYSELPSEIQADFQFMRASSVNGLYSLNGYQPGMSSGIEEALLNRGALSKLNDSSKWLLVAETLDASVQAPQSIVSLLAYEAPRAIAMVTLARKVSLASQEITLSELDANTLKLFKTLRKISNKNDLVVLSTNDLIHDIAELAPILTPDLGVQEEFVMLYCKLAGITTTEVVYQPGCSEAEKRLIRLAAGQWRYDYSSVSGLSVVAAQGQVNFMRAGTVVGSIIFSGPFEAQIAVIETNRSPELQTVIDVLAGVAALVDTASLSKAFSISPTTNELTFSYTIDQLRDSVAEVLVDTERSMYKRS